MVAVKASGVLRVLRERAGLTARQLAEKAGVSESVVADLENDVYPLSASGEAAIAIALGFVGRPKDLREPFENWAADHPAETLAQEVVRIDPETMSGEACFPGTRVPVQTLVDYLVAGDPMEDFLSQHPTATREQARSFVQAAANALVSQTKPVA